MPRRKSFHNRLEELFVKTRPDLPGPWEDLLTRVEPEMPWRTGPGALSSNSAAGRDLLAGASEEGGLAPQRRTGREPRPVPSGWKDFLQAVQRAEPVEPGDRNGQVPITHAGPPGWKDLLHAVQYAEEAGLGLLPEMGLPELVEPSGARNRYGLEKSAIKGQVLSTSLPAGDEQLVSIEIEGSPERAWSDQEASLLNSIAQQIALHLENLRLLEQAEQYRQEADQVVQRMTRTGWEAYLKAQRSPLSGFVYDHGRVYPLETGPSAETSLSSFVKIVQPIKVREEIIGQLVVEPAVKDQPADLVRAIAERLGLQIESLRLLEETEQARQQLDRRAAELETVAQVSTAAASLLDPQALLQAVVDLTQNRFQLYHAQVYLFDEDAGQLILAAGSGEIGRAAAASQLELSLLSNAAVAQAIRNRSGLIIPDTRLQSGYQHYPFLPDTLSELAVPMITGELVIGAFSVLAEAPNRFYIDDMRTFATLASQVAVALRNAELYAEQMATVERLRELDQLKSAFLANMSHELRTPLNSILGFAQVITEGLDGPLTEDMANDLQLIEKNGRHLLNLINDVLDMAKIEAGRLSLDIETFDLYELIQDVLETASPLTHNRSVDLRFEPKPSADLHLRADRFRIRQILLNLVGNAIKFTENGTVVVTAWKQANLLRVGIQDTGIGIPPEKLETIFEAFSQVDTSTTRKAGGTGLGLPISRRLVEMHGGRLWAESRGIPGEGTTFWLELPVETAQKFH